MKTRIEIVKYSRWDWSYRVQTGDGVTHTPAVTMPTRGWAVWAAYRRLRIETAESRPPDIETIFESDDS